MNEFLAFTAGLATGASVFAIGMVVGAAALYGALLLHDRWSRERRARKSAELAEALQAARRPSNKEFAA